MIECTGIRKPNNTLCQHDPADSVVMISGAVIHLFFHPYACRAHDDAAFREPWCAWCRGPLLQHDPHELHADHRSCEQSVTDAMPSLVTPLPENRRLTIPLSFGGSTAANHPFIAGGSKNITCIPNFFF